MDYFSVLTSVGFLGIKRLLQLNYFRFSTAQHNHLRNKHLAEYLRNINNSLSTVRFSVVCGAMLANNSIITINILGLSGLAMFLFQNMRFITVDEFINASTVIFINIYLTQSVFGVHYVL